MPGSGRACRCRFARPCAADWGERSANPRGRRFADARRAISDRRIERLFCNNERAVLQLTLAAGGQTVTLVAIAAILVASIRLHCLADILNRAYRGPSVIARDSQVRKGDELGWFQNGSTIIVFAPEGFTLCQNVREGATIRLGEPLMRLRSE